MLHLKQILHKNYTKILSISQQIKTDLKLLGVVPKTFRSGELGKLLYCPMLLVSIAVLTAVTCISSLLSLLMMILMKLQELFKSTEMPVLNVPFILCPWEGVPEEYSPNVKEVAEACMERGWRSSQVFHIPIPAMHGEPNNDEIDYHEHELIVSRDLERTEKQKNQLDKAMKAKIDPPMH